MMEFIEAIVFGSFELLVLYGVPALSVLFVIAAAWATVGWWSAKLAITVLEWAGVRTRIKTDRIIEAVITLAVAAPFAIYSAVNLHEVRVARNQRAVVQTVVEPAFVDRFVTVEIDPPKHMYVTVKRVSDGAVFGPLYVSKHCSYDEKDLHQEINLQVHYRYPSNDTANRSLVFDNLYQSYCN